MTGRWNQQGTAYRLAETLFDQSQQVEAILARAGGEPAIGPADLMAYISDPACGRAAEVEAAVSASPRLRGDLEHLLLRMATHSFPRLAAASSGGAVSRVAEGCRITLRPSRADPSQIYVLIGVDCPGFPKMLFVNAPRGLLLRHPLPPPQDGTIQLILDEAAILIAALRDITVEVYLR